jgi:hypothetical protein
MMKRQMLCERRTSVCCSRAVRRVVSPKSLSRSQPFTSIMNTSFEPVFFSDQGTVPAVPDLLVPSGAPSMLVRQNATPW